MVIFDSAYKQQFTQTEKFFTYRSLSYSTGVLLCKSHSFIITNQQDWSVVVALCICALISRPQINQRWKQVLSALWAPDVVKHGLRNIYIYI